ncbi:hypothetical protein QBC45DRAFT_400868 [Copromyces sp. CBS 386.78]|nr:hypothetical protein QBC45DRAFT_400868 [Copromyces sp. CBS 386.78]
MTTSTSNDTCTCEACRGSEDEANVTSTSTFHPFPRLPWELRALIWELAVSPRVVDILTNAGFKKDHPKNGRVWSRFSSELSTYVHKSVPVLQACQEARNHLTDLACGNGYYEKILAEGIYMDENQPGSEEGIDDPYAWVNFEIDMIDIGLRRYKLSAHYVSKIKRIRFETIDPYRRLFEVLVPGGYYFPNVKEAEIYCYGGVDTQGTGDWGKAIAWNPVENLVCEMKDVVFRDPEGWGMTLPEMIEIYQKGRMPGYRCTLPRRN